MVSIKYKVVPNIAGDRYFPTPTARFPVSAPGGQPCRSDQIYGENPAADVIGLMSRDGKVRCEGAHGEHGCDKDPSRQHMAGGTFAESQRRGPGHQPHDPA